MKYREIATILSAREGDLKNLLIWQKRKLKRKGSVEFSKLAEEGRDFLGESSYEHLLESVYAICISYYQYTDGRKNFGNCRNIQYKALEYISSWFSVSYIIFSQVNSRQQVITQELYPL
ncbi:hypothetical protein LOAG_14374 [Loa loa]|uniref:Uncharacterized protein n=1 Tax=Loa loa TaxID=7209 RepID=A0A1S0TIC7_LOALO|nr:hypothetical protein LOAG_14374 [Loa loa]EFO14150.1 hypothetical protein LOAG_14374 [Loa loa]